MNKETFMEKHGMKIKVAGGIVVGVAVGVLLTKSSDAIVKQVQVNIFSHNNTVTTELARRGHPGFIVKHLESGVVAASKNHLAHILDVSRPHLDQMIVDGTVEVLGLAR